MNSDLYFDGKKYISSKKASTLSGYSPDYIGQLCRGKKILNQRVGKVWYVSEESLINHVSHISKYAGQKKHFNIVSNNIQRTRFVTFLSHEKNKITKQYTHGLGVIKHRFYRYYPYVADYFADRTKNPKFLVYESLAKKVLVGTFVFFLAFSFADASVSLNTFADQSLEHIIAAPKETYDALRDVTNLYAADLDTTYITFGNCLNTPTSCIQDTTKNLGKNLAAASVLSTSQHINPQASVDTAGVAVYTYFHSLFSNTTSALAHIFNPSTETIVTNNYIYPKATSTAISNTPSKPAATIVQNITQNITQTSQKSNSSSPSISTAGLVSQAQLATALQNISDTFSSRLNNFSVSQSTGSGGNVQNIYQEIASTQKIDNLSNTTITNPTITGGSINGTSFSGGNVSATSLSANTLTIATSTSGCAQFSVNGELISTGINCGTGSGNVTFATSTSQVAGVSINHPTNATDIVAIGGSATTSAPYWFDPNTLTSYLSASTTLWDSFYTTPSSRITAGTGLSWSGNTLNVSTPFGQTWEMVNGYLTPTTTVTANLTGGFISQASSTVIGALTIGKLFGAGLTTTCDQSTGKLIWNSTTGQFSCGVDAGSTGGLTSLAAQYSSPQIGSSQTFATTSDANIGLIITSASNTHTFSPTFIGQLSAARGGTGLASTPSYGNILVGNTSGGYTLIATSSLGLPTFAFPFTPQTYGVSTGTTVGFLNGLFSTASSTFSGSLHLSTLSDGALAVYGGLVSSGATTTAGTGLTYSGNAFNVNTSQNISTLSNLATAGFVKTASDGTLSVDTNTYLTSLSGAASSTLLGDANTFSGVDSFTNASSNFAGTWQTFGPSHFQVAGSYLSAYDAFTHPAAGQSATTSLMLFNGQASTTQLTTTGATYLATTGGNVGIGTTSPGALLHVLGTTQQLRLGYDASNYFTATVGSTGITTFDGAGSGLALNINQSINMGAVANISFPSGRAFFWSPDTTFANAYSSLVGGSSSLNIGTITALPLIFKTSNLERVRIDSSGNVGIGTTTPQYLLNPFSSTASQLSLSAGAGVAQWAFRNAGGNLYLSTTTVLGTATTSQAAFSISGSGFGTTTLLGLNITGQATSTSNVGLSITNGCFAVNNVCLSSGLTSYDAWTHPSYGGSATTSLLTLTGGFLSTASSTFSGSLHLNTLSDGALAVYGGLVTSGATTTAGTGLTYSGNTFNVNTSQNIATLSNLTTNGFVKTTSNNGTLAIDTTSYQPAGSYLTALGSGYATTSQTTVAFSTTTLSFNGLTVGQSIVPTAGALTLTPTITGTLNNAGLTNSTISGVALGNNLFGFSPTDGSLHFSNNASYDGTIAVSVALNLANANTWTALQSFNYSSSTIYSSFVTASTTNLIAGNITLSTTTAGCLNVSSTGQVFANTCSTGLTSYDAFTHPSYGGSATTSLLTLTGGFLATASSTIVGNATTTGSQSLGALILNGSYFTNLLGSGLVNTAGALSVSGLTTANFASTNISQWTNDANYITDPFTHPTAGQSATTSLMLFNGQASTTQLTTTGATYLATTGGNVGIGTTSPGSLLSIGNTGGINLSPTGTSTFGSSANGINLTNGCFAVGGVCLTSGLASYDAFTHPSYGGSATTSLLTLSNGFLSNASSTINGQLTVAGAGGGSYGGLTSLVNLDIPNSTSWNEVFTNDTAGAANWMANFLDNSGDFFIGNNVNNYTFQVDQNGNAGVGLTGGSTALNTFDVNGNAAIGTYAGTKTAPSNGLIVSGNVGIGTTNPLAKLDITGVIGSQSALFNVSSTTAANTQSSVFNVNANGNVGIGTSTPWGQLSVNPNALGSRVPEFVVGSSTATHLVVLGNGNVGIGTTGPIAPLQVVKSTTGGILTLQNSSGAGESDLNFAVNNGTGSSVNGTIGVIRTNLVNSGDADIAFSTWGTGNALTEKMRILSNGNVGIGTSTPWGQLSVNPNALGSRVPEFVVGSSTATHLVVLGNGNVGIGTTGPVSVLDVEGSGNNSGGGLTIGSGLTAKSVYQSLNAGGALISIFGSNAYSDVNLTTQRFDTSKSALYATFDTRTASNLFKISAVTSGGVQTYPFVVTSAGDMGVGPNTTSNDMTLSGASFVVKNGNVGIGTTTPLAKLDIAGVLGSQSALFNISSTTATNVESSVFNIQSNGNVGIGTTAPGQKLDVAGNVNVSAGSAYMYNGTNVITASTTLSNYFFGNGGNLTMTGSGNLAIGSQPFISNTTGTYNTAIGYQSLLNNTTGSNNTAFGFKTLYLNTTGGDNTAFGRSTLYSNTTGSNNTAFGEYSGYNGSVSLQTISNSTFLGYGANSSVDGITNSTAIGNGAQVTASNQIVLGNSSVGTTIINGNVGIGTTTPLAKLDITGVIGSQSALFNVSSTTAANTQSSVFNVNANGNVGLSTSTPFAQLSVNSLAGQAAFVVGSSTKTSFIVDQFGNVGVGTASPTAKFTVNATCTSFQTGGTCTDYAEVYPASEAVDFGDVVSIDATSAGVATTSPNLIRKSTVGYDNTVLGVVSTNPAIVVVGSAVQLMSGANYHLDPLHPAIALAGRVPVKVTNENGPINPGDFLTTSATVPGYAMKATQSGEVIGQALGMFDGSTATSTVLVFIKPGYQMIGMDMYLAGIASTTNATSTPQVQSFVSAFFANMFNKLTQWFADAANGIAKFYATEIHTQKLCVADASGSETCITKSQLDALISNATAGPAAVSGGTSGTGATPVVPVDASSTPSGSQATTTTAVDTSVPVLHIAGDNPATISVGTSYIDLGATVTDRDANGAPNDNIDITATLDAGPSIDPSAISIDTSTSSTHTIIYSATDQAGNTGTATRVVNVVPAQ